MASKREQVIQAVLALLKAAVPDADVQRNRDKAQTVDVNGDIILRDGAADLTEETLSPHLYWYDHALPVQVAVRASSASDADLDSVLKSIGTAIESDRYLGGLVDWLEPVFPETDPVSIEGARAGRWADLEIVASYSTPNPLT